MLALLGGGLFVAVRRQISGQLDASLQAATAALMQAARIRETEQAHAKGAVVDAVDELHIPDRSLYLLDSSGRPIKPERAPDWIQDAAREAASTGRTDRTLRAPADHELRLHAERFTGSTGTVYVAAAVADRLELEDEYASLIRAFGAAALVALLLVAGGGYLLVRQTTAPIERSLDQMRRFMAEAPPHRRHPLTSLPTRAPGGLGPGPGPPPP